MKPFALFQWALLISIAAYLIAATVLHPHNIWLALGLVAIGAWIKFGKPDMVPFLMAYAACVSAATAIILTQPNTGIIAGFFSSVLIYMACLIKENR